MKYFKHIFDNIGATFSRYAATIIYCVLLAVAIMLIGHHIAFGKKYLNNPILLYLATGVFVSFCIDLCRQIYHGRWMTTLSIVAHVVIVLNAIYLAYITKAKLVDEAYFSDIAVITSLCVLAPFIVPFIGRKEEVSQWNFYRGFVVSSVMNGAVAALILGGLMLLVNCSEMLFGISLDNFYLDTFAICGCLLLPVLILMRLEPLGSAHENNKTSDKFSVIVFRLFLVLLCIYLVVLYAYIFKIVIEWNLPQGKVAVPVICMMALLILVKFISIGIERKENDLDSRALKLLPWLAMPALVLMSIGIGRRIADYGFTAPRFYLIVINVWFYAICIYWAVKDKMMPVILSFVIAAFVFSFGPASAWRLFPENDNGASLNESVSKDDTPSVSGVYMLHPHEELPQGVDEEDYTKIFLAGTINMGNSVDWQAETARIFDSLPGGYILYNPRQEHWNPDREGEMDYQVNWELEHLEKADYIIMNFLPSSQSPITLLEMGIHIRTGKLRVCCPAEFYRYDNVRITCSRYGVPLYEDWQSLIKELINTI